MSKESDMKTSMFGKDLKYKSKSGMNSDGSSSSSGHKGEIDKDSLGIEKFEIKIKKKKKKEEETDKEHYYKEVQKEMTIGLSQYVDLEIGPVKFISAEEYKEKSRKQKKLYNLQGQLFGRDLLEMIIKKFNQINEDQDNERREKEMIKL